MEMVEYLKKRLTSIIIEIIDESYHNTIQVNSIQIVSDVIVNYYINYKTKCVTVILKTPSNVNEDTIPDTLEFHNLTMNKTLLVSHTTSDGVFLKKVECKYYGCLHLH